MTKKFTESESSLIVSKGLKIIDSLNESTVNLLKHKKVVPDDLIANPQKSELKSYNAHLSLTSYFFYFKLTLEVEGLKTFYGSAGGIGFVGKGDFSGTFYIGMDDLDTFYQEETSFVAVITPVTMSLSFLHYPIDKAAQFDGIGLGSISATIGGGGYWE
ncbi:VapA/VapB family virulence-associated protein [Xenorhabdus kozodoii]|uniref:Virulence associated protein VapA n=1 Tax=Xenorhabdus kozodoii TaxID=351676 RepID=A0A2D0L6N1_9GAMM|nr:VapA/VapB family virulence-associated protein [Xenorhabdus kozodoii]PHM69847.1 hypothetical protein Xkoz_03310 [Xenorhabdus kozodoii]PHM71339.1 hypothetical protein Xkoz_02734 [Xenorhabdus kozodoii]